jgi:hypothetical protein
MKHYMKYILLFFACMICVAFASESRAQTSGIPQFMAFQGFLSVDTGAYTSPAGGIPASMFLYDDTVTRHEVWSHNYTTAGELVKVFQGYYTVILDFNTDRKNGWDGSFNKQLWLSAIINNQLLNTVRLTSAPYAFNAKVADTAKWAPPQIPVGTIMAYALDEPSADADLRAKGWRLCDGDTITKSEMDPNYFSNFQNLYGSAGANAAYLPDLRGLFLRGVSKGRADSYNDPDSASRKLPHSIGSGNQVGSIQPDAYQAHNHSMYYLHKTTANGPTEFVSNVPGTYPGDGWFTNIYDAINNNSMGVTGFQGNSTETRPKNAYVYWIIKVK